MSMFNFDKNKSCKRETKTLQELNLIDSFLFGASTEKTQDAEFIAKLIIERATGRKIGKVAVVSEKVLTGVDTRYHGIRMDLFIEEYENERTARIYDIEPNKYGVAELPMRSRYSQALTDVKLLSVGDKYEELPEYISIWILPYDPFGQNRMLYTVQNFVAEDTQIVYNDGVKKLFLYVGGEVGGNEELKNLLHYFSESDATNVVDTGLEQLHSIVETVKGNRELGERFMTVQDIIYYEKKESFEEGINEGIQQGIQQTREENILVLMDSLKELGISEEQIVEKLMEKYSLSFDEAKTYLNQSN